MDDIFMIVEYIRYRIENEKEKFEFENAYKKAGSSLNSSPHCLKYRAIPLCGKARKLYPEI